VTTALSLRSGAPLPVAIAVALGTGALCGLYNGLLVTALRLPPFIATLGTLGFFRGVSKWLSDNEPVRAPARGLDALVQPFPTPAWMLVAPGVWIMLALVLVMLLVERCTIFGRYTFAIGSNESTARLCGVRVPRTKLLIYLTAGLFIGLAGLLQFARLGEGDPTVAMGLELEVIAAVVIGGASLSGGQGSVFGTLIGAVLLAYMRNRCVILGWSNDVQEMIVGHVIIAAVAIDQWRVRRSAAR
jgi:ribose transport system permease protein